MVSKVSNRIFDVVVSYLAGDSFSTSLTPPLSMDRQSLAEVGNELSIDYTVPAALCRVDTNGKSYFTVSAILALLDDFSSYALMLQDRNHRPGVSVTLDTEILKTCQAGDKIRLVSRCDKIGKSVAFLSMELLSAKGDVIARGKHIKYVKMGFGWDLLTSFLLFPIVLMIVEYLVAIGKKKRDKASSREGGETSTTTSQLGRIFEDLKLTAVTYPAALFTHPEVPSDGEHKKPKKKKHLPVFAADESCFTLKVTRTTSNVMGHMHGGAVAAAAEEACVQQASKNGAHPAGRIDGIQVSYISPMKVRETCTFFPRVTTLLISPYFDLANIAPHLLTQRRQGELIVAVREDPLAAHRKRSITEGRVISKKTGQVCAEFKCHWAL